jgi:hypothetical protein
MCRRQVLSQQHVKILGSDPAACALAVLVGLSRLQQLGLHIHFHVADTAYSCYAIAHLSWRTLRGPEMKLNFSISSERGPECRPRVSETSGADLPAPVALQTSAPLRNSGLCLAMPVHGGLGEAACLSSATLAQAIQVMAPASSAPRSLRQVRDHSLLHQR